MDNTENKTILLKIPEGELREIIEAYGPSAERGQEILNENFTGSVIDNIKDKIATDERGKVSTGKLVEVAVQITAANDEVKAHGEEALETAAAGKKKGKVNTNSGMNSGK